MSTNILNRDGVAAMVADCLKADTTTLYGASKLVQVITSDPILFINAAVDINSPYKLFIWAPDNPTTAVRTQNSDEVFVLNYRVEGLAAVPEAAFKNIDKIDQEIKVCINDECYTGKMFTNFYTDAKGKVWGPNEYLDIWKKAGNKLLIHGWTKRGDRGKRKVWTLREVIL